MRPSKVQDARLTMRAPRRKVAITCAGLLVIGLALVMAARTFGPMRPLDDVVIGRLNEGGAASFHDHQPEISRHDASVFWEVNGNSVYLSVNKPAQPQAGIETEEAIEKTQTLRGIKADLLLVNPSTHAWRFECEVNSLLYDFGSMNVVVRDAQPRLVDEKEPVGLIEKLAAIVPDAHRFLRCG